MTTKKMKLEFWTKKDGYIVSKPWYAYLKSQCGFKLTGGPFRSKKQANRQIETWKEIRDI